MGLPKSSGCFTKSIMISTIRKHIRYYLQFMFAKIFCRSVSCTAGVAGVAVVVLGAEVVTLLAVVVFGAEVDGVTVDAADD